MVQKTRLRRVSLKIENLNMKNSFKIENCLPTTCLPSTLYSIHSNTLSLPLPVFALTGKIFTSSPNSSFISIKFL